MKKVVFTIRGETTYSQGRKLVSEEKLAKETPADHENRVWRERAHADANGDFAIPTLAIKNGLAEAARFLGQKIPGKGHKTYTKIFETGVIASENSLAPILDSAGNKIPVAEVKSETVFVPSNGVRGSGKRVYKNFPIVEKGWTADVELVVLDSLITPDILKEHMKVLGRAVGIGRWRPLNNGLHGRFSVTDMKISDMTFE